VKKFRFRLETPLRLRRRKEDKVAQELARAHAECIAARLDLERLEKEREVWAVPPVLDGSGTLDLTRDQCRRDYVEHMEFRIQASKEIVRRLAHEVSVREGALRIAVRDRQILERLKEIRKKSHREDMRALEMKRMDFAASAVFRRSTQ
jgi:flagellar FliJ protein